MPLRKHGKKELSGTNADGEADWMITPRRAFRDPSSPGPVRDTVSWATIVSPIAIGAEHSACAGTSYRPVSVRIQRSVNVIATVCHRTIRAITPLPRSTRPSRITNRIPF